MAAASTSNVPAAVADGEKEAAAPLNRDELSLYSAPRRKQRPQRVEDDAGQLEQSVAALRRLAEPYTARCGETYGQIKPKVHRVVQFGNDTIAYLKNPPKDFYPRAGVICFTGVLGLFLARGSRIKKLVYPAGLVTVSASLYYPEQAAAIARSTGDSAYDSAVRGYAAVERMVKSQSQKGSDSKPWWIPGAGSEKKPAALHWRRVLFNPVGLVMVTVCTKLFLRPVCFNLNHLHLLQIWMYIYVENNKNKPNFRLLDLCEPEQTAVTTEYSANDDLK